MSTEKTQKIDTLARRLYQTRSIAAATKQDLADARARQHDLLMQTEEGKDLLEVEAEASEEVTRYNRMVKELEEQLRSAAEEEAGLRYVATGILPSGRDIHPHITLTDTTCIEITDKAAAAAWLINHEREDLLEIKTRGKDKDKKSITLYFQALAKARFTPPGISVEQRLKAKIDSHERWGDLSSDGIPTPEDFERVEQLTKHLFE